MRFFILTLIMALWAICGYSQSIARFAYTSMTGHFVPDNYVSTTSRDVYNEGTDIKVSFSLGAPVFMNDTLYQGTNWCFIDDFGVTHKAGTPSLPIRIDNVRLPFGADSATVEVVKVEYEDLPYGITPSHPTPANGDFSIYTTENVPPIIESKFGTNSDFVEILNFETTRNYRHVNVAVKPCQYDAVSRTVRVANKLEYIVKPIFNRSARLGSVNSRQSVSDTRNRIANSPSFTNNSLGFPYNDGDPLYVITMDYAPFNDLYISYLIITLDKYLEAANKFALSKKRLGLTTYVSSRTTWSETQVKDSIQAYYNSDENIAFVLLIGDVEDIPAKKIDSTIRSHHYQKFPSDFYYGCLQGANDTSQDVYIGRFSVSSLEEANNIVDKTIEYISKPFEKESFYQKGIHVAYFGDTNNDVDGFVKNSEDARLIAVENGIEVERLYYADGETDPLYFESMQDPLPDYLRKPFFKWDADKYKITDSINAGASYILYRGHGHENEWANPNFKTSDFSLLKNKEYPVFFNTTCFTGKYDYTEDCFAEKLLKFYRSGAVGTIACSQESLNDYNRLAACSILENVYKESKDYRFTYYNLPSGEFDSYSALLGKILQDIHIKASKYNYESLPNHRDSYNLFGDPSLAVWTDVPCDYSDTEISENKSYIVLSDGVRENSRNEIQINLDEEGCFVGAYDKIADKSYLMLGSKFSLPYFDPERFDMTIYGINRRPKILYAEEPEIGFAFMKDPPTIGVTPNPVTSSCTITYNYHKLQETPSLKPVATERRILVVSLQTGGVVRTFITSNNQGSFPTDFSSLPSGYYMLYLTSGNGTSYVASKKMIVQ